MRSDHVRVETATLTVAEAARLLSFSERKVRLYLRGGLLCSVAKGRRVEVSRASVEVLLRNLTGCRRPQSARRRARGPLLRLVVDNTR
jgi:hypothetical protein